MRLFHRCRWRSRFQPWASRCLSGGKSTASGGHRSALLDLGLFSYSTFSWGNITAGAVAIGEFAIIFVLPLYLINALDLSTMSAGLVLAAMAIGVFFSGAAARRVAARFGAPGTVLIGLGLEVVGVLILVLFMGPDTNGWIIAAPLTLYGLGLGFASAQLTGTVLRDIPVEDSGQASATQSTVRQIGSSLGTAVWFGLVGCASDYAAEGA